jgi:hypothetical protein
MGSLSTTTNILSYTSLPILYEVPLVRAVRQPRTTLVRTAVAFPGVGRTSIAGISKSWNSIQRFEDFWVLGVILGISLFRGHLRRHGSDFWISLGLTGCLSSLWKLCRLVLSRAGLLIMYNMYNAFIRRGDEAHGSFYTATHGRNRDERHCSQNLFRCKTPFCATSHF